MLLRRFNAEAEAVAKLIHPNTVNIYDFGQDTDGSLFIAMEFIEGRSLRDAIAPGGAAAARAARSRSRRRSRRRSPTRTRTTSSTAISSPTT